MADNSILIRLDGLKLKYEEIGQKLTDPEVIADVKQFIQLTKEYKELEPIIETSDRFRTALANLAEAKDSRMMERSNLPALNWNRPFDSTIDHTPYMIK